MNIERKRRDAAVGREDPLDDEELEGAFGAALLGEEDLCHSARAEAADDLELGDLLRRRGRGLGHLEPGEAF